MTRGGGSDVRGAMTREPQEFEDWLLRFIIRVGRLAFWPALVVAAWLVVVPPLYLLVQGSVNAQLGFDYATPQLKWNDEPFLITRVVPGGVMARAGLRVDDRVLMDDVSKLYALLIRSQGGRAEIPIERGGRARTVVVRVPRMRLLWSAGLLRLLYGGN